MQKNILPMLISAMAKLLQQSSEPTSWWIRNTLRRCMAAQFEIVFEEGYGSSSTTRGFFNACSHWIVRVGPVFLSSTTMSTLGYVMLSSRGFLKPSLGRQRWMHTRDIAVIGGISYLVGSKIRMLEQNLHACR